MTDSNPNDPPTPGHVPVMIHETIECLHLRSGQTVIDCTFGVGGHTRAFLDIVGPEGHVISLDRDSHAIAEGLVRFEEEVRSQRLSLVHQRFAELASVIGANMKGRFVDAIFADLGVASTQLDRSVRGFSFQRNGPLDMRMNPDDSAPSASQLINSLSLDELTRILREFGEEPHARRIARAIVAQRERGPEITQTSQLADLVSRACPSRPRHHHPATRTFQALRIAVNHELDELKSLLDLCPAIASSQHSHPMAVAFLTYHSLEDRLVKQAMNRWAGSLTQEETSVFRHLPIAASPAGTRLGHIAKPFPQTPTDAEVEVNPRARSAKLRAFEFLENKALTP